MRTFPRRVLSQRIDVHSRGMPVTTRAMRALVVSMTVGLLAPSSLRAWVIVLLLSLNIPARSQATKPASPYAYNGRSFSLTVSFKMYTSYEFDGGAGGDLGNPGWVVVSNLDTGKSASFPYLQALQLPQAGADYHDKRWMPRTESKWVSRLTTANPCCLARAAIQMSWYGMGRPRFFNSCRTSA